jgi:hypothetical protein
MLPGLLHAKCKEAFIMRALQRLHMGFISVGALGVAAACRVKV